MGLADKTKASMKYQTEAEYLKALEDRIKRASNNPKFARKIGESAGIIDKNGRTTKPYRKDW